MIRSLIQKLRATLQQHMRDIETYQDMHPAAPAPREVGEPEPVAMTPIAKQTVSAVPATTTAPETKRPVVTRIPPSPTGTLHVGTARTALYNLLFAKQHGGKVFLRMEDTDKERSKREFEQNLVDGLTWLGITWDNAELYRQSEQTELYKTHLEQLIARGAAYLSKEDATEGKRSEVIRFKNPNKVITFTDLVRGDITFDTTELGDFVIAKALDEPLYHLAVVVDDITMGVTHVIRGEDHISNTPRQILILEALGAERPQYAHIPLLLGEDRSKLSKRHGAKSINELKEEGYIAEAVLNYLALLGWNPGDDREFFTLNELVQAFSLSNVQKGGAIFTEAKLRWFNREYLKQQPQTEVLNAIKARIEAFGASKQLARSLTPLLFDRIDILSDVDTVLESGEFDFFFGAPTYEVHGLLWKKSESLDEMRTHLLKVRELIEPIDSFTLESIKDAVWSYASDVGRGNVLWPFRFALSGQEKSPDPFEIAEILGKEETLARIDTAVARINDEA